MADRMQDVFPIVFDFKRGEQPSSSKLTKWVQLEDIGFDKITLAVGDPWDYQTHTNLAAATYYLSPENLSQPSIARMIGPSDYISPSACFNESAGASLVGTLAADRNSWNLGIPLVKVSSSSPVRPNSSSAVNNGITALIGSDLTFSDLTTFATPQTSAASVTVAGDYYVDFYRGVITSYSVPTSSSTVTIADLHIFGSGAPWSTPNVLPTWNDGANKGCLVTLTVVNPDGTYTYTVAVPTVETYSRANPSTSNTNATGMSVTGTAAIADTTDVTYSTVPLPYDSSYRLPYSIESNLVSGDTVPSGFCFLWSNTGSEIIPNATFEYTDVYTLTITCPQLTDIGTVVSDSSDTAYRLVINGASLAEQVNWLTRAYRDTWHDGLTWGGTTASALNYSTPLSHDNMSERYSWTSISGSTIYDPERLYFTESNYPTNCHPQYLHRYGYMDTETTGNTRNAMRGNLVFASQVDYDFNLSTSYETYGITFGLPGRADLSFIGGSNITTVTPWVLGQEASRTTTTLRGTGAYPRTSGDLFGSIAVSCSGGNSLHLRGSFNAYDTDYEGGLLSFGQNLNMEGNYIKLLSANRSGTFDAYNMPANTSQSSTATTTTCPGLAPSTSYGGTLDPSSFNRLSADQIREFRFRAVSYVPGASNIADSLGGTVLRGAGSDIDEFEHYFTSPGMVGADFFNVYSNSIFFSDTGEGKTTSFTDNGDNWLDSGTAVPSGIHYVPNPTGSSTSEPYFYFSFYSGGSATQPLKFGDEFGFSLKTAGNQYLIGGGSGAERAVVEAAEEAVIPILKPYATKIAAMTAGANEPIRVGTYGTNSELGLGTADGDVVVYAWTVDGTSATRDISIGTSVSLAPGSVGPAGDINIISAQNLVLKTTAATSTLTIESVTVDVNSTTLDLGCSNLYLSPSSVCTINLYALPVSDPGVPGQLYLPNGSSYIRVSPRP